jgi:transketolase
MGTVNNMLHQNLQLDSNIFDSEKLQLKPTRDGFGSGLIEAGNADERVVVLCADLAESTRVEEFKKTFPGRYIEIGVAEQNLAAVASGMANYGKIPFIASYAAFSPGRNNEQIRTTIALNGVPVIIAGCHAGISVGPDGATHQALEDIGLMRMIPNMTVVVPCDAFEAHRATVALAQYGKPGYLRLGREKTPVITTEKTPFVIGQAYTYIDQEKPDVVIFACGPFLHTALLVSESMQKDGVSVSVVNVPTIKPLDTKTILEHVKKSGAVITIEEHQRAGGLGSAIAEYLVSEFPVPMEMVAVQDRFGQSGNLDELTKEYNLDQDSLIKAVSKVLQRKLV